MPSRLRVGARVAVGLIVVGDEILSGKRQDKHFAKVIELLRVRGMELGFAHVVGDDEERIAEVLLAAHERGDAVLSCGGIGGTPDDCTRQAAARAYGREIALHQDAAEIIISRYGDRARRARLRMAEFPVGAGLIPNPVNQVPGFFVEQAYFVPGFPEMAWPMLEWVLDERLAHLHNAEPDIEYRLRVRGAAGEGDLIALMEATLEGFPGIRLSSLPARSSPEGPRQIEFGIKGPQALAAAAYGSFLAGVRERDDVSDVEELARPDE